MTESNLGGRSIYEAYLERWRIFNEMERREPPAESTPAERVHIAGELFDSYVAMGGPVTSARWDEETMRHARRMRRLLAPLRK